MKKKLALLYGKDQCRFLLKEIEKIYQQHSHLKSEEKTKIQNLWSEKDIALIVYGDSFAQRSQKTAAALKRFLEKYIRDKATIVHILPFFPYSSDRGFSVIDYYRVNRKIGDWDDIVKIAGKYRLMADLVLNHVSVKSPWFQKFLAGDEKYWDYFIHFDEKEIPQEQIKKVFRPRSTPLLTPFSTKKGRRYVWTTFSVGDYTDQVDLNYQNPEVLLEILKIIAFYVQKGIRIFRLDAITYVWKKLGTSCFNLPESHLIVQIIRQFLKNLCPEAIIITETNVPHEINVSYFGDGKNEAQMVYNFSLPPLVFDAFVNEDASYLSHWAKNFLKSPSKETTFFNFLDSHDGIGILGAKGILPESRINHLFKTVEEKGGKLSFRINDQGEKLVYEMNITWWSAINGGLNLPFAQKLDRFLTSRAISMALPGVPAVYYLSLLGQENDQSLFERTKINRDINRTNYDLDQLERELSQETSPKRQVLLAMLKLFDLRQRIGAFNPNAAYEVIDQDKRVFAILRQNQKGRVLALHNVSSEEVEFSFEGRRFKILPYKFLWIDLDKDTIYSL